MTKKVSTTNDNGRNANARNLMASIPFYLKADSSLGPNDEKSSEHNCDAMVHKVCYDPTNMDTQMYKIYLSPFDTGSVEQWLKFLTKLNLIITGNGLMTGPAKFNLTQWSLLKGDALQHFNNKAKKLGNETNAHHTNASMWSPDTFPQEGSSDAETLLAKDPSPQFDNH